MNVEIKIGADLPKLADELNSLIGDLAWQIASGVETEAKRLMQQSTPTGRTYRTRRKDQTKGEILRVASIELQRAGFRLSKHKEGHVVVGYWSHRASAAGQPPAPDTTNLVNSIRAQRVGKDAAELRVNAGYAGYLEPPFEGEGDTSGLLNRPFLAPSIDFVIEHLPQQL